MLMNLSDYRSLLDDFLASYPDPSFPPNPSLWRYMIEWWPEQVRRGWSGIVAKHETAGLDWKAAEWEAFKFIASDTKRHDSKNPDRKIKWQYPPMPDSISLDESNIIDANENFFYRLNRGAEYNANLGPSANEQLDEIEQETKKKIKETEEALKSGLSLEKQTTARKRSTVKREPKEAKAIKAKEERPSKKRSKFDSDMGALF